MEPLECITIFGVGRLGLCLALVLEKAGYHVLGVDVVKEYVDQLNLKTFVSNEPQVKELLTTSENFRAITSLEEGISFSDVLYIMVPTPTSAGPRSYDHSILSGLLMRLNKHKLANKHIIIGCTVIPGYISNVARFLMRDCQNITISYNPEFIAQGDIVRGLLYPDMVLIGEGSKEAGDIIESIYHRSTLNSPEIHKMNPESAEITKLSINCFITMKISFANQIGDIADRTPLADKIAITKAIGADTRVGSKCILPGYGFGGPCFSRDNRALVGYAETLGVNLMLGKATDSYNKFHAQFMADELCNQNLETYVFKDVAYKSGCPVPIIEESQVLEVARLVRSRGFRVIIQDRKMILDEVKKEYGSMFEYENMD